MKTRRPKKVKKGKTIRKRKLLIGGEKTADEQISENKEGIAEAFSFMINEKYDVHDFASPKCASAMIKYYQNVIPLKNEWGTGKFKDQDVVLERLTTTTNHLVDLYPDVVPFKSGVQMKYGGIGWDFNKETQFLQIMKEINKHPISAKTFYYDGLWKGFSSKFQRFVKNNSSNSQTKFNFTAEFSPHGVYLNSTRELEDIIHYYWCLVSYLLFIISKISAEKRNSLEKKNDSLIEQCKQLIDEYAKWNLMLESDVKKKATTEKDNNENIVTKQPLLSTQYNIIHRCQTDIRNNIKQINALQELEAFKKQNGLGDITTYELKQFNTFNRNITLYPTAIKEENVKKIDKLTNKKKDFVEVFTNQIKQSVIEANESKNINEFEAEEKSMQKYALDFKAPPNNEIIVSKDTDTLPQIINKLKLEYNTNSEFIIRIMHLLERLGNNTRDGKNVMNHGFIYNKKLFYNHPFNRFAKTYISGIRTLIETLIDIHTNFKINNPTASDLKIDELSGNATYVLRKNDHNLVHAALKRFYRMGNNPGTLDQSGPRSFSDLGENTVFKTEFTNKFSQLLQEKEIKMRFTNLDTILTDLNNTVLSQLVFNTCDTFLTKDQMYAKGDLVDLVAGMWPKTEYNKLKSIWSDTSASGLVKMDTFLKEKNKFSLDGLNQKDLKINATFIKVNMYKIEQKILSVFVKENLRDEDKQYLKNIQNCFLIINHYAKKIKDIIKKGKDLSGQWKSMADANNEFDKTKPATEILTYLWMNNVSEYFANVPDPCTELNKIKIIPTNIDKVFHHVSASLLNKIIMSCKPDKSNDSIVTHLDIDFLYKLTDDTVQKHLLSFVKNINKPNRAEELSATLSVPAPALSYRRKHILFRLLTLANPEHLSDIFGDRPKTDAIITKMHKTVLKGGGFNETRKKNVFNIRTAYDNIFKNASPDTIKILVQSLFLKYPSIFVDVIKILGDPNPVLNEDAIRKMKEVVNEDVVDDKGTGDKIHRAKEKLNTELNDKKNRSALNYYTSVRMDEKKSVRIDEKENPPKENNDSPTETAQIKSVAKKPEHQVENEFREKINVFVLQKGFNGTDTQEEELKIIHKIYDDLAAHKKIIGNKRFKKNVANNLIDYAASVYFGRMIESELEEQYRPKAFERRDLFIDQFTRLNTKPNVDPFLERVISTFWPEADAINYKRPPTEIITKKTLIETKLYPTLPTVMLEADTNPSGDTPNQTYGRKIMTVTEKVDGDQSDYDALGVEMFLNTLLTTGSNVSVVPKEAYGEEYEVLEKVDNSAYISKEK